MIRTAGYGRFLAGPLRVEMLDSHLLMRPSPLVQRPAMARMMEVLPAPLGPTMSRDSPCLTCTSLMNAGRCAASCASCTNRSYLLTFVGSCSIKGPATQKIRAWWLDRFKQTPCLPWTLHGNRLCNLSLSNSQVHQESLSLHDSQQPASRTTEYPRDTWE